MWRDHHGRSNFQSLEQRHVQILRLANMSQNLDSWSIRKIANLKYADLDNKQQTAELGTALNPKPRPWYFC